MNFALQPLRLVHTESSCGWGGQEIRILTESRGFLDRGHQVTLVAPSEAPIVDAARRMGVPVVALPMRRKRLPDFLAVRRWIADHRRSIDVLVTHSSTDSWLASVACKTLADAPAVVRVRHISTKVHDRMGTRWLYRSGNDRIVTTGEAIRLQLIRENGVAPRRVISIPTGIDLARFVPGDTTAARARLGLEQGPAIGIVATLRAWKGHVHLFEAIARDRAGWEGWQTLVVGGGPDLLLLKRRADEFGLVDCVRFAGHQEDVVPWFHALDIFVLPSYGDEGVPQAIMQAMACGLPVVSTPVGAIGEVVDDGATGILTQPSSPSALGIALAKLRDDPGLRAIYSRAARLRAERDFGIARMLDRMESVFRELVAER